MATPAPTIVDTGFLVALFDEREKTHSAADRWLAGFNGRLLTVESVLTEAAFFLPVHRRPALADLAAIGTIELRTPDKSGYQRIASLMRKYASLDPDWADICLIWLAETNATNRILTMDLQDFSVYRIRGRERFDTLDWHNE